jgi:fatty-acyl-CoA synthase
VTFDLSRYLAARFGDRVALVETAPERTWTYRSLDRAAEEWANVLTARGVVPGDRVSLMATNRGAGVALLLGCWKLRVALAPHNYRCSAEEFRGEMARLAPATTVVEDGAAQDPEVARSFPAATIPLDAPPPAPRRPTELAGAMGETAGLILSTGGSTGPPKSAVLSVRALVANALNTASAWGLGPDDVGVAPFPFFHTGGWNVLTLPLLFEGGRSVLLDRPDPTRILAAVAREEVTVLTGVPATLIDLVALPEFETTSLSSLRFVKSGGGQTPERIVRRFLDGGIPFYQGYGLTEAGPNLFYSARDDLEHPGTIGRATPLAELALRSADGDPVDEGELFVRGPLVFSGYLGNPEATREALVDGWVATGDCLRRDAEGFYYFVGRRKLMFKSGGENVYPTEVEAALESHPAVVEAAVVGIPDPRWGEVGCAFVRRSGPALEEELVAFLRRRLAHYKVPRRFVWREEIPRTPAGKKDYPRLRREAGL